MIKAENTWRKSPPLPPSNKLSPSGPKPRMITGMTVPNFWMFFFFMVSLITIILIAFLTA